MIMSIDIYQSLSHKAQYFGFMLAICIIFFNVMYLFFLLKFFLFIFIDIHIISFSFLGLVICTYFSWSNYYLAQKCDPGVIVNNRDQQYRVWIDDLRKKQNSSFWYLEYHSISWRRSLWLWNFLYMLSDPTTNAIKTLSRMSSMYC